MKLGFKEKAAYGIGAVGKDMVYMLSASYILYYYQDIMGVSAWVMGIILLIARVFDAFNDPLMGAIVAGTKTKWGKFRPWLFIGTLTNAIVLFFMFAGLISVTWGLFGQPGLAAAAILMWGTGDAAAALIGIPCGKHKVRSRFTDGKKSWEGTAAMFLSAFAVGFGMLWAVQKLPPAQALLTALAAALAGAVTELFTPGEYDTVTVPLVIAAVLLLMNALF